MERRKLVGTFTVLGRRFRSAKEAEMNEKKARDRGEDLPKEDRYRKRKEKSSIKIRA